MGIEEEEKDGEALGCFVGTLLGSTEGRSLGFSEGYSLAPKVGILDGP